MQNPEITELLPVMNRKSSRIHTVDVDSLVGDLRSLLPDIQIHEVIDIGAKGSGAAIPEYRRIQQTKKRSHDAACILFIGGDGLLTVQAGKILTMLEEGQSFLDAGIVFAHLTAGQFNLREKQWGLPRSGAKIAAAIRHGSITQIDSMLAKATIGDSERDIFFLHSFGMLDPLVHAYEKTRKPGMTLLRKVIRTIPVALDYARIDHVVVDTDSGNGAFNGMAGFIETGNGKLGYFDLSGVSPWEGVMDVIVVPADSRRELVGHLLLGSLLSVLHKRQTNPYMVHLQTQAVRIATDSLNLAHYDAEPVSGLVGNVSIEKHPGSFPILREGTIYQSE